MVFGIVWTVKNNIIFAVHMSSSTNQNPQKDPPNANAESQGALSDSASVSSDNSQVNGAANNSASQRVNEGSIQ